MVRRTDEIYNEMLEEYNALKERVDKLDRIVYDCRHNKIVNTTLDDIHLMEEQLTAMNKYLHTLKIRIARVR